MGPEQSLELIISLDIRRKDVEDLADLMETVSISVPSSGRHSQK